MITPRQPRNRAAVERSSPQKLQSHARPRARRPATANRRRPSLPHRGWPARSPPWRSSGLYARTPPAPGPSSAAGCRRSGIACGNPSGRGHRPRRACTAAPGGRSIPRVQTRACIFVNPVEATVRMRILRRADQTRTHTIPSLTSAWNRCTLSPRIVVQRPSLSLNRQRCSGQTTSPSSTQPWPSEPPACGQRSEQGDDRLAVAERAPGEARQTSSCRPLPEISSSNRHTADPLGHPSPTHPADDGLGKRGA